MSRNTVLNEEYNSSDDSDYSDGSSSVSSEDDSCISESNSPVKPLNNKEIAEEIGRPKRKAAVNAKQIIAQEIKKINELEAKKKHVSVVSPTKKRKLQVEKEDQEEPKPKIAKKVAPSVAPKRIVANPIASNAAVAVVVMPIPAKNAAPKQKAPSMGKVPVAVVAPKAKIPMSKSPAAAVVAPKAPVKTAPSIIKKK